MSAAAWQIRFHRPLGTGLAALWLACAAARAGAVQPPLATQVGTPCEPLVYGYSNQELRPYFLGNGASEARPPGASVELVREMAASAGCGVVTQRLPPARLQLSLENGSIATSSLAAPHFESRRLAYPLAPNGQPDRARGLPTYFVVYVRAADRFAADADPAFFKHHKLGTFHGASYAAMLRQAGYEVDDGAPDERRNFEKLRRHRIDGYAVAVVPSPDVMDALVQSRYGGSIARLARPLGVSTIWMPVNRAYYERNLARVETMWNWLGTQGQARFNVLVKQYNAMQ